MKRKLLSFLCVGVLAITSLCAVPVSAQSNDIVTEIAGVDDEDLPSPTGTIIEKPIRQTRLDPEEKTVTLTTTSWKKVYSDNNWTDVKASITNKKGNPGTVLFKIEAKDGTKNVILFTSGDVKSGLTWISEKIASSYDGYTVYAKAKTKTKSMSYVFVCDDL